MRLKITYLFILLLVPLSRLQGQNTFEKEFNNGYFSNGNTLIQTKDNGFLVCGEYIFKVDSIGNLVWSKFITDDLYSAEINAICNSSNNHYIIAGTESRGTFISKIDSLGNIIWKVLSLRVIAYPTLAPSPDGGCIIAAGDNGGDSIYVMRIANDGELVWRLNLLHYRYNYNISSIIPFGDTSFLICGGRDEPKLGIVSIIIQVGISGTVMKFYKISSTNINLALSICKLKSGGFAICGFHGIEGNFNIYIAKFDSLGSLLWGKEIESFGTEDGRSIIEAGNEDLIVVCGQRAINGTGGDDSTLILRMDKLGNVKSVKLLNGFMVPNAIIRTSDNEFVFTGNKNHNSDNKMFLMKLDSESNGCNLQDQLFTDHLVGTRLTDTLPISCGGVLDSSHIILKDIINFKEIDLCNMSSVSLASSQEESISLSPNPLISGKLVKIHVNENLPSGIYELSLLDLLGNTIRKEKIYLSGTKQDILFDISKCVAGAYIVELQSETRLEMVHKLKFIKEN